MDRRTKYTKKVIMDTLIDLLSKKDIKKITVSEICKIADVNRATFYRYYLDEYDLLSKIEEEFVNQLKNASSNNSDSVSSYFLNDILGLAYERCQVKWKNDLPNISQEDIEYASIFIFNGALGVVNFWVQNNFDKEVDEVAKIIEKLSYYGTKKFIYKK